MPLTLFKPESVVVTYLSHLILLWGVVNICALTYDRFVAAMMPLQYPCRIPKIFKRTLVAVWLIPTIISLLPLFWATDRASIFHKWYIACSRQKRFMFSMALTRQEDWKKRKKRKAPSRRRRDIVRVLETKKCVSHQQCVHESTRQSCYMPFHRFQ